MDLNSASLVYHFHGQYIIVLITCDLLPTVISSNRLTKWINLYSASLVYHFHNRPVKMDSIYILQKNCLSSQQKPGKLIGTAFFITCIQKNHAESVLSSFEHAQNFQLYGKNLILIVIFYQILLNEKGNRKDYPLDIHAVKI